MENRDCSVATGATLNKPLLHSVPAVMAGSWCLARHNGRSHEMRSTGRKYEVNAGCSYNLAVAADEEPGSSNPLTPNFRYDITCTFICQLLTVGNYQQFAVLVNLDSGKS